MPLNIFLCRIHPITIAYPSSPSLLNSRFELRAGQCAGAAVLPDRLLQRRLLRALGLPARAGTQFTKEKISTSFSSNFFFENCLEILHTWKIGGKEYCCTYHRIKTESQKKNVKTIFLQFLFVNCPPDHAKGLRLQVPLRR